MTAYGDNQYFQLIYLQSSFSVEKTNIKAGGQPTSASCCLNYEAESRSRFVDEILSEVDLLIGLHFFFFTMKFLGVCLPSYRTTHFEFSGQHAFIHPIIIFSCFRIHPRDMLGKQERGRGRKGMRCFIAIFMVRVANMSSTNASIVQALFSRQTKDDFHEQLIPTIVNITISTVLITIVVLKFIPTSF